MKSLGTDIGFTTIKAIVLDGMTLMLFFLFNRDIFRIAKKLYEVCSAPLSLDQGAMSGVRYSANQYFLISLFFSD